MCFIFVFEIRREGPSFFFLAVAIFFVSFLSCCLVALLSFVSVWGCRRALRWQSVLVQRLRRFLGAVGASLRDLSQALLVQAHSPGFRAGLQKGELWHFLT